MNHTNSVDSHALYKELKRIEETMATKDQVQRLIDAVGELTDEEDGELTEWAKKQLEKARAEPEENYISHEDLKREILNKP